MQSCLPLIHNALFQSMGLLESGEEAPKDLVREVFDDVEQAFEEAQKL